MSSARAIYRTTIATLSAGALIFESGCSLMNPHVTPETQISPYAVTSSSTTGAAGAVRPVAYAGGVGEAIDYVNGWRAAYYQAVGEQSMLKNGITLAVIPAAAVAGYFGLTGTASRKVITALAVGAAGVLGIGTFLESENRQKIYLAGYRSMGCILFAAGPLLMEQGEYVQLKADLGTLDEKIAALNLAITDAQNAADALRARSANAEALSRADIEIRASRQLQSTAETARDAGAALYGQVTNGRLTIETAAGDIASQVSDQIVDDEPRLSALTEITGGLPGAAQRITVIPPAKGVAKAPGETADLKQSGAGDPLQDLIVALNTRLDEMRARGAELIGPVSDVRNVVAQHVDAAKSLPDIKGCGFTPVDIGIKITPPDTSVEMNTGESRSIMISGGKRPYAAILSGQIPPGVTLSRSGFDQQPVVAVVTAGAATGDFDLAIADAAEADGVLVHFRVKTATPADATTPQRVTDRAGGTDRSQLAAKPRGTLTPYEATLNDKQIRMIQAVVGSPVDGKLGDDTWGKVQAYQASNGLPTSSDVDDSTYRAIARTVDGNWAKYSADWTCGVPGAATVYECLVLTLDDLTEIQGDLKATQSGSIDAQTREQIRQYPHKPAGLDPNTQVLSVELANAIRQHPL